MRRFSSLILCLVLVLATHMAAATAMGRCRMKAEQRLDGLRDPLLPKDGAAAEAPDAEAKPTAQRQVRVLAFCRREPLQALQACERLIWWFHGVHCW